LAPEKGTYSFLIAPAKKIEKRIEAHKGGIFGFLVLEDHSYISYGEDGRVCHWTMNHELCGQEKVSEKSVRCGVFINHEQIFFGTSDHTIAIFDVKAFRKVYHWEAHGNSVFALAASGQTLYSVGRDALLKSWKLEDCTLQGEVPAHMYSIHGLNLNAERNLLLTSSMDKTIKIWDAENLNLLKVIDHERYESHTNCVNKVLWIDSNRFISCSDDRKICLFNIEISDERE
jgi:WD40 repeat protein